MTKLHSDKRSKKATFDICACQRRAIKISKVPNVVPQIPKEVILVGMLLLCDIALPANETVGLDL